MVYQRTHTHAHLFHLRFILKYISAGENRADSLLNLRPWRSVWLSKFSLGCFSSVMVLGKLVNQGVKILGFILWKLQIVLKKRLWIMLPAHNLELISYLHPFCLKLLFLFGYFKRITYKVVSVWVLSFKENLLNYSDWGVMLLPDTDKHDFLGVRASILDHCRFTCCSRKMVPPTGIWWSRSWAFLGWWLNKLQLEMCDVHIADWETELKLQELRAWLFFLSFP